MRILHGISQDQFSDSILVPRAWNRTFWQVSSRLDPFFIVVSGVPGSGKSTLGAALALTLGLRFLDKDDFLEQLFESKGVGDIVWRRGLSRESDLLFQMEAANSEGAVLVSHWRLAGMPANSGTPTQWLS